MLGSVTSQAVSGLAGQYGSRMGFLRTNWYRFRYLTGGYRNYSQVDWDSIERLVFICRGNICRSAFAETVAHSLGLESVSCGIETKTGLPANADAVKAAAGKGYDLEHHKTTQLQNVELKDKDLIVAMEPWQIEHVIREIDSQYMTTLLGLWGTPVNPYIQDPYGASSIYFDHCFNYIEKSVNEVARKINRTRS